MLRLILLRHAKAVPAGSMSDRLRPLDARGQADAAALADPLHALAPALALISPATRTMQTWQALGAEGPTRSRVEEALYNATAEEIAGEIALFEEQPGPLLVVAHNPGLHELALALARTGDREALAHLAQGLPPAGLVVIDCDATDWDAAMRKGGRLAAFRVPARG